MRKQGFQMATDGIEMMGTIKRAVRVALTTGAKTLKDIQQATKETLGDLVANTLTLYTAANQMIQDGDVIKRDNEYALF